MKIIAISIFVFLAVTTATAVPASNYTFEQYIRQFNKNYTPVEFELRRTIFERNIQEIQSHNTNPNATYLKGVNQFTDSTVEELRSTGGYSKSLGATHRASANADVFRPTGVTLPPSFDWRNAQPQVLTPVKSQGHCGSCWTFAAAESVEAHWAIATGHLENLSQQQMASCSENPFHCGGTGGCHGATVQIAYEGVLKQGGLASEWTYPYLSFQGKEFECEFDAKLTPPVARLESYLNIEQNSYDGLMEALVTRGPIAITVDASTWHTYSSGVFNGCDTTQPDINHGVLLVGYGTDPVQGDYWVIRNSWGPNWGENGYIRIQRTGQGVNCGLDTTPEHGTTCDGGPTEVTVCGMCGILYDNTFPVVAANNKNTKIE